MKAFKILCILIFTFLISEISANYQFWLKIMIDHVYIQNDLARIVFKTKSRAFCGAKCSREPICNSWCHHLDECIITSIFVSPSYAAGGTSDPTTCYTKKRRDIVVGASTFSSELESVDSKSELTTDGIFLKDYGPTFKTKETQSQKAWILYDLKKSATIFEVLINHNRLNYMCDKIIVRIGNFMIRNGDFSPYQKVASKMNSCDDVDEYIHFKPAIPMEGQFVVVHRSAKMVELGFDHIEIDGEFHQ